MARIARRSIIERIWHAARRGLMACLLVICGSAAADEIRPAYLQLTQVDAELFDVFWRVPTSGGERGPVLNLIFDEATRPVTQPLTAFVDGAQLRRWRIARPSGLAGARLEIEGLRQAGNEVLVQVEYLDGAAVTHRITPAAPYYLVEAQASWWQIIRTYFVLGVEHILFGIDHLLFVFALLLLVRELPKLVATITAFTVAHSITLICASLGLLRVPVPPVEACIALSIAFVATEIIRERQGQPGVTARFPWLAAFAFGLLHGLGFAAALAAIGLPQNALVSALLVFNLGVEIGQLLFVFAILSAWHFLGRLLAGKIPGWLEPLPAYSIGGLASFWVFERAAAFWN